MGSGFSSEQTQYHYRPIRALSLLLEGTWIGLVLLDAFVFFRPQNLSSLQVILWLALCSVCIFPSLYLHLNYLKYSRGRKITLEKDRMVLSRDGESLMLPYSEIVLIEVHFWRWAGAPWRVFDYFILKGPGGKQLVIPSHLLGYLGFARNPLVQDALTQANPPVTFIKRFPRIEAHA